MSSHVFFGVVEWCDSAGKTFSTWASVVGQGPTALAVGASRVVLDFFFYRLSFLFFFLPVSWRRPEIDLNTVLKGR